MICLPFKDPEKARKWKKEYNQRPDVKKRRNEKQKEWRKEHVEQEQERFRKYYNRNKTNSQFMKKVNEKSKRNKKSIKIEVLTEYSKKHSHSNIPTCACCGENFHEIFLTIDHINAYSKTHEIKSHSRLGSVGSSLYYKLRREGYPEGYQVLCMNCNVAKGINDKCPHERKN